MKRFVVLIIVLVALSVANAQQTRQVRVPRTPKSLQQKSEDYKNRAIPTGLRGLVPNYAAIGSRPSRVVKATKNSTKPAGDNDNNLLNLKISASNAALSAAPTPSTRDCRQHPPQDPICPWPSASSM